jgi:hypothetical protein
MLAVNVCIISDCTSLSRFRTEVLELEELVTSPPSVRPSVDGNLECGKHQAHREHREHASENGRRHPGDWFEERAKGYFTRPTGNGCREGCCGLRAHAAARMAGVKQRRRLRELGVSAQHGLRTTERPRPATGGNAPG